MRLNKTEGEFFRESLEKIFSKLAMWRCLSGRNRSIDRL